MKPFYLIALFTIISFSGFSQFKEGFIITNNNDTISGYIKFEGSLLNSDHCAFELQPNNEAKVYKPGDIKAFRFINSKYFETREISVNDRPQKVFLEWLIQGRASILTYTQSISRIRYFLLLEDNSLVELTNTSHVSETDSRNYIHDNKEYIGLLKFYYRDCPSLQNRIETLFFDSKSLISITKDYHDRTCETGNCIIFEDRNRKLKLDFGISADFLNSTLILNNTIPEKMYASNTIGYGLAINITNLPLLSPKFSARMNIVFHNSLYKYDTTGMTVYRLLIKDNRMYRISYLRIPVQLAYNFSQKKLTPYISVGSDLNLRLVSRKFDKYLINYTMNQDSHMNQKIKRYQLGLNSGLGLNYILSPDLKILFGYEFEYAPGFFGESVNDYSYNKINLIHLAAYFKFKK